MVSKFPQLLLFTLLSLTLVLNASAVAMPQRNPVTKELNPDDPVVVQVGQFAVSEYNDRSKARLTFVKVIKGESQTWTGTLYRLIVRTMSAGPDGGDYNATVFWGAWQPSYDLISFIKL